MQPLYTAVKVNNEIELCEVSDPECKQVIERELLHNRISYFIRFPKSGLFGRKKNTCIICVNDNVREDAEEIVHQVCEDYGYDVKFLLKKSHNAFL
ncbi:MAG: hypothetical protein IJ608_14085 [Lachnospiraceae bacterium]|nr:hypothetical protein [Lachnospiraceae bacterium]